MKENNAELENIIEMLHEMKLTPEEPIGISMDGAAYGIVTKGDYVWVEVTRDGIAQQYEIMKRDCLDVDTICDHTVWYDEQKDYETAWSCIAEALHKESALPDEEHHCRVWWLGGLEALKCGEAATAYNLMNHALLLPDCTNHDAIVLLEWMARILDADGQAEAAQELRNDAESRRKKE